MSDEALTVTGLTRAHIFALTSREDLLAEEAALVAERHLTWAGRLRDLGGYGTRGGSALDRRLIVEGMVALEAASKRRAATAADADGER